MLELLKKMFGIKPAEQTADAPYKVEVPVSNDQTQVIAAAEASATTTQPASVTPASEVTAQNKAAAVAKAKKSPAAVEVSAASMKEELKNPFTVAVEQTAKTAKTAKAPVAKKASVPKTPRKPKTS